MKKKIYVFLLVFASVIACMVCLAACNNGDSGNGVGEVQAEYVGKYEFYSTRSVMTVNGEEQVSEISVDDDIFSAEWYQLDLNADGSYTMTINETDGSGIVFSMKGVWGVSNGKLALVSKDGSSGGYNNATLIDGILILYSNMENVKAELKLKKVVETTPAE